jgi:Fe-S-cluster-containing hydrogenase component 2
VYVFRQQEQRKQLLKTLHRACNLCAEVCPTQAIDPEDISKIDKWQCIICFACIKNCPSEAKQMTDPHFNGAIQQLQKACLERKEPEMYL